MTNYTLLVMISGIFITNITMILAAWIKMKTDITAINVKMVDIELRVKNNEVYVYNENDKRDKKLDTFVVSHEAQHNTIADKIDIMKTNLTDLKVDIAKISAKLTK